MEQEKNNLKRAWIWLWFNDWTRMLVLLGLPILPCVFIAYHLGMRESLKDVAVFSYLFFLCWAMTDNDYSNLRRIGMDEYRRKLNKGGDA
jgi:hypothetical protein